MAKRKPAGEQAKGLTLTIRISPKTKFVMELLARKQRRTVSAVIEWLAMQAAEETFVRDSHTLVDGEVHTVKDFYLDDLWDADEIIRFINLFKISPDLMTYDEELLIGVIRREPELFLERSQSIFFETKDGETDAQILKRILNSFPDSNRYMLFSEDYSHDDDTVRIGHWLDLALTRKAWPHIKKAANQEITPEELHRIVEELKDGIEIQQADAPGVPKARSRKKDQ